MHYDTVQNYAMKCRLYPTKAQKQSIDDALHGLAVFHNCLVYDMWHNGKNVTEKPKKVKDGTESDEKVHFPNIRAALTKEYKDQLLKEHPIIEKCPQAAITTNVGLKADLQKEFGRLPIECQKPKYYNDLHPRLSYTYQESISKIQPGENVKAFWINLSKLGPVKVRGWNQKLRFGVEDAELDFLTWAKQADPKTKLTVTVSRDKVGDYFIVFKIKTCRKPFAPCPPPEAAVGVDVGIKDLAICSDGTKFANPKFKKKQKRLQRLVNRKMARRWGPANEEFRDVQKKNRAEWRKYRGCVEN
ncbi:MAG: transposase, partial [Candidatus Faecousia sp.]|nr:transposase [Candidatus Faecousia sp.]